MKTDIFYFSGTGNCLSVAGKLGAGLKGSVTSIARLPNKEVQGEILGIVSPIYMYDMPHAVIDFLKRIERAEYLFFVFAGGGEPGNGMLRVKRRCKRLGLPLSACYNIAMPSNYIPFGCPDETEQERLLDAANERVESIIRAVSERVVHFDKNPSGTVRSFVHPGLLYRLGHSQIKRMDGGFRCNNSCRSCGICEKVCPVGNISMENGKPQWHHHCEQCFACLNWCPEESIQYRESTQGARRYHHPEVNAGDIIASSGRAGSPFQGEPKA